jgi:uncharacterized protein (TIGR02996 family)
VRTSDQIRIGEYTLAIEDGELEVTRGRSRAPFLPRDKVESELLRAIGEGDQSSREVYADWLEEHGHAAEAEFVRVQQALVTMAPEDTHFEQRSARLRELTAALYFSWRVRVARPVIERCPTGIPRAPNVTFDFQCPKQWGNLAPTEREDRRFCGAWQAERLLLPYGARGTQPRRARRVRRARHSRRALVARRRSALWRTRVHEMPLRRRRCRGRMPAVWRADRRFPSLVGLMA